MNKYRLFISYIFINGSALTYSLKSFGVFCIFLRGGVVMIAFLFFGEGFEVHEPTVKQHKTQSRKLN